MHPQKMPLDQGLSTPEHPEPSFLSGLASVLKADLFLDVSQSTEITDQYPKSLWVHSPSSRQRVLKCKSIQLDRFTIVQWHQDLWQKCCL